MPSSSVALSASPSSAFALAISLPSRRMEVSIVRLTRADQHVITIRGDSYRLRAKRRSGLVQPGRTDPGMHFYPIKGGQFSMSGGQNRVGANRHRALGC